MAACSDKSVTIKKKMIDVDTIKDLKKLKAEVLHLNIHIHVCTGANGSKLTKKSHKKLNPIYPPAGIEPGSPILNYNKIGQ